MKITETEFINQMNILQKLYQQNMASHVALGITDRWFGDDAVQSLIDSLSALCEVEEAKTCIEFFVTEVDFGNAVGEYCLNKQLDVVDYVEYFDAFHLYTYLSGMAPKDTLHWHHVYDENGDLFFKHKYYCPYCGDYNTYGEPAYCPDCGHRVAQEPKENL